MLGSGSAVVTAIAYIVAGICFCIFKAGVLSWIMTIVGLLLIVQGIMRLVRNDQTQGIVYVVVGAVILIGGWLFVKVAMLILGAVLVCGAVMSLAGQKNPKGTASLVYDILTLVMGVCLMISPWAMIDWFFVIIGVLFVIKGALAIINEKPL